MNVPMQDRVAAAEARLRKLDAKHNPDGSYNRPCCTTTTAMYHTDECMRKTGAVQIRQKPKCRTCELLDASTLEYDIVSGDEGGHIRHILREDSL